MKKIYTSIDLGTDNIKIVVSEVYHDKQYVLATSEVRSVGFTKGVITDMAMATNSLNLALEEVEKRLSMKIEQAIVNISFLDISFQAVLGETSVMEEDVVSDTTILKLWASSLKEQIDKDDVAIMYMPLEYKINQKEVVTNVLGKTYQHLKVKALTGVIKKEQVSQIQALFDLCHVKLMDIIPNFLGDYYMMKTDEIDSKVGVVINIGYSLTNITVFNKGVPLKHITLDKGSSYVDKDISYIYKMDAMTARKLKETFALAKAKFASLETIEMDSNLEEKLVVTRKEISEIVEARLDEMLKNMKKQINLLTNRKIEYIMVTGGITEIANFSYLVEEILGNKATVCDMSTTLGVRNNKYSTVVGNIYYYDQKLSHLGQSNSMINDEEWISQQL